MNRQRKSGVRGISRTGFWLVWLGVALLPLAFEVGAADALEADAVAMGGYDLQAVLSDSGGQMVSMGRTLSPEPEPIAGLTDVLKSDGGTGLKAALKSDGTVWSLTRVDTHLVAAQIPGLDHIVDIATSPGDSPSHFVALKNDGTVWTWGFGAVGQLGNGATSDSSTPVQVLNLDNAIAIAAGTADTYVVRRDGTFWGCGAFSSARAPFIKQIPGIDNAIAVAASGQALVLKSDGTVMGMGANFHGQIGDGTRIDRMSLVAVAGLSNVIALSAGNYHSLALKSDASVWAWGHNMYNQCGVPARYPDPASPLPYEALPVQANISGVAAIDAGKYVSAAIKSDRTVWIWGRRVSTTYSDLKVPTQVFYDENGNSTPILVSPAWADPATVTLPAGTTVHVVASDPEGDALSYTWSQVSGAGTATFAAPAAADSGVTFSAAGSYGMRVTIDDGNGVNVTSDVTVKVQGGDNPGAGDVNGDKVVNIADLLLVIDNFGKTPSDAGYDARADANGDGLVNILDVIVVTSNFGKTY